jgi:phospholipid/cholesterol/gamma-HCH transport system permease protein
MPTSSSEASAASIAISRHGDRLTLEGVLDVRTLAEARRRIGSGRTPQESRALDLGKLRGLDTPGALFLRELGEQGVALTHVRAEHQALLDLIGTLDVKPLPRPGAMPRWRELVVQVGKGAAAARKSTIDVITFIGLGASAIGRALIHPRELRLAAISRQISDTGIGALPVVGVMALMISIVIGYQGVAQLRPYGGEDFTVNLVAVSVLREMGVLITAIMVAGRSGSAFTAEIGVMKAREELDALNVMGMDPLQLLVVPRLIGLVVTLPILTFYSDLVGLLGGAVIAQLQLDISPVQYLERVRHAIDASDVAVGLIKAPIFGFLIATIGCMHGLKVKGSAESVGHDTTRAVVKAIFIVIVLDALFSILFEKLGL